jgi:hypothetical protein
MIVMEKGSLDDIFNDAEVLSRAHRIEGESTNLLSSRKTKETNSGLEVLGIHS